MRFLLAVIISVGLFFCITQAVAGEQAGVTVKSVSYNKTGAGTEVVRFILSGTNHPKIFMLEGEKPRLVLDFAEAGYEGRPTVVVNDGTNVQGIRIGAHHKPKRKTRVVVDLVPGSKISWNKEIDATDTSLSVIITTAGSDKNTVPQSASVSNSPPVVLVSDKEKVKTSELVVSKNTKPKQTGKGTEEKIATPEKKVLNEEKPDVVANAIVENGESLKENLQPVLVDVSFDNEFSQSGEMVLLRLNDFQPPEISTEEKGSPKIYSDFARARLGKGVKTDLEINAEYIKRVRVLGDEKLPGVRVVLDLAVGLNYDLQQVYFKEDNLFVLIVNKLEDE